MKLYKQKLLSNAQLKRLSEHKYSCSSTSFFDNLLQPWWTWLVGKVPLWLAPNLITIVGLLINIITTLILAWYAPDAKTEAPRWACFLCALGLFIYQSLDAIDGKQARRTNSVSPLGELFDHGCDSVSTVFVALSACIAVQLGYHPGWMFFQCFCAMTLFYCAHWQTYVSGTLRFGKVDVTEAQFSIIAIQLISAVFGPSIWSTKIPGLNMEVKLLPIGVACAMAFLLAQANVAVIFTGGVGKNGSTVAGTSVLSPIIPFSMVLVPAFIIYRKSIQNVYEEHPALYILAFGMVAAKVTNRLVVAHMTKSEMEYMDWSLIGPAMLFFNQYFNTFIPEYIVLWLCMVWVMFDLLRYSSQICSEICDHLHIELFRIPYPGGPQRIPPPSTTTLPTEKNGNSGQVGGPMLLYSTMKDVRIVRTNNTKVKPHILVRNLTDGAALDFNYADKKVCWTDHGLENIQCATFDGVEIKNKVEIVTSGGGLLSPDGLACDWFTNKLYWTDSETNRIEVATTSGEHRKVLFWADVDQPRAIALVPMKGLMFWTDWGEVPKIERAGMNGDPATRKIIVSEKIFWPNGLTIDYDAELIYWIDGRLLFIDVMDYNGDHRSTILQSGFEYPFALTQFQNKFYWTDWKTWSIHVYDRNSTQEPKEFIHSDFVPMDIHAWDARRQPIMYHPCESNNGGCSHLCLLAPYPPGYSCACPVGIKLVNNLTCAEGPQELLILARRTDICVIYLDSADYTHKVLPLNNIKYTIAVDYDPVDDFIYWTDDEVKKIQKARLDGTEQEDIIVSEIQHPDGIAIDWIARNVYWTDTGTDRIEVARLNGKYRKVIISEGLFEPRAIAVAPQIGWMFWSDWNEKNPKIERSNLDGSERDVIISSNLGWPNGVTLDLDTLKVYWCDAKTDKIEYSNMDGSDRRELINDNLPHVFGFSLMGDYLYWTDWQRRAIDRVHKESGGSREVIVDQIANVMGLKAIRLGEVHGSNPCGINNGGCSHICLYRHNETYICTCQIGYELTKDGHKCVVPEAFLLYTRKDSIGRISIENGNNEMTIPINGVKHASSVDFDIANMRIYWSDIKLRVIMRAFINGSDPQRVVELGLASPEGIAVDWIAHNIYWTDSATHRIEVARYEGSSRRTLIWRDIDEPHSIALYPQEGYMYWSEWGHSNSIKRAAMDGSNQKTLVMNTRHATGLTLDYERKRMYWVETTTPVILSSDFNGLDKQIIVKDNIRKPIALCLYKEFLYWSDEITGEISTVEKTDPSNRTKIHYLAESATDLLIFHSSRQKGFNQCGVNNGGCSHLCLAQPAQAVEEPVAFTCACPTHYVLQNNTCLPPKRFMIYSQRNLAVRLLPDTADSPEAVLPIQGLKGVKAIDFDPVHHCLYWVEGKTHSIKRASDAGLHMSVIIPGNQGHHPFDIAVDALGRLLFWSCASQDVINVTRLDNSSTVGIVIQKEGEKPRLLAIHPTKRLLFYTDVGSTPQLVRTRMDGTQRIVITKGSDIAAIAVDSENDLIVWAQGHSIYMCNIDGDNHHVVFNESNSRVTQLAIHSGWLYWLDREIQQLQRLELKTGSSRSVVLTHASLVLDLVSVKQPDRNHSCAQTHHIRCSHLCIINGSNAVCACPHGLALQDDKRTCSALPDCGTDHFTCSAQAPSVKDCIPIAWRCDGQMDCPDGSDEAGCPACRNDQFKCQNGQCIDQIHVCDGIAQCPDNFDEAHCCKSPVEFRCPLTDVCISVDVLCDGIDNCADGADERRSVCMDANRLTSTNKSGTSTLIIVIFTVISAAVGFSVMFFMIRKRINGNEIPLHDQSEDPLSPMQPRMRIKAQSKIPDVVHMSMLNGSHSSSYDRNHITGASSSTNSSSRVCYPRETLNPPPSPATTAASTRGSSPSSRYRPYRHYRSINQPPPPTPCSTDVCDESDYNYPTRSRYDGGPIPPPPTPRSQCHSESCPPSPSSRSSTYFSPLPPPPSPVPSPTN